MGNDKIAAALGLTVNSAKVMVNELIREGYLLKSTDINGYPRPQSAKPFRQTLLNHLLRRFKQHR